MTGQDWDRQRAIAGDPDFWLAPCPRCDEPAEHGCYEKIDGSVNIYLTVRCDLCGFSSGFDRLTP